MKHIDALWIMMSNSKEKEKDKDIWLRVAIVVMLSVGAGLYTSYAVYAEQQRTLLLQESREVRPVTNPQKTDLEDMSPTTRERVKDMLGPQQADYVDNATVIKCSNDPEIHTITCFEEVKV